MTAAMDAAPGAEASLIDDASRALIGTEVSRATGTVVKRDFQRWAAAVGDRNPLYFDEGYARAQGYRDVVMPPLFLSYVTAGVMDLAQLRPRWHTAGVRHGRDPAAQVPPPDGRRRHHHLPRAGLFR